MLNWDDVNTDALIPFFNSFFGINIRHSNNKKKRNNAVKKYLIRNNKLYYNSVKQKFVFKKDFSARIYAYLHSIAQNNFFCNNDKCLIHLLKNEINEERCKTCIHHATDNSIKLKDVIGANDAFSMKLLDLFNKSV